MNSAGQHQQHEPSEWATLYALGELSPDEKDSFDQHLGGGCTECETELRAVGNVMVRLAAEVAMAPPASVREQLLKRVAEGQIGTQRARGGVLLQKTGLLIARSEELPWEAAPLPGILSKSLYVDAARKYSTSLVRLEPKAVYPSHRHSDIEEVFLLEGDFRIEGVNMKPGDYCRSEPGTVHGQSTTISGALLLVFASQQDELLM